MNLTKLIVVSCIALAVNLIASQSINLLISNSNQNYNRDTHLNGEMPTSYTVTIQFDERSHKEIVNGGGHQIDVRVLGSPSYLSSGMIKQIHCEYNCIINSSNNRLSGNIRIQQTRTLLGNQEESETRKKLENDIIQTILNQIQNL